MVEEIVRAAFSSPLRRSQWNFRFPDVKDAVNIRVQKVSIPGFTINTQEVILDPSLRYELPESITYGDVSLTIIEHRDQSSMDYFTNWKRRIQNDDGTFNPRAEYVKTCYVELLDSTEEVVVKRIQIINAYPKSVGELDLDYNSNELVGYEVTLSCVKTTL